MTGLNSSIHFLCKFTTRNSDSDDEDANELRINATNANDWLRKVLRLFLYSVESQNLNVRTESTPVTNVIL